MELDYLMFILAMQMLVIGCLAMSWGGVYYVREDNDPSGWGFVVMGALALLFFSWLLLSNGGWIDFGLAAGLPALASIPVYWFYRFRQRSRVFIWIAVALWPGLVALGMSVHAALSDEGGAGYWGLVAAALASGLIVYGYRKLYLRKLTLSPAEMERARRDPWGAIGAAVGVSVGGAILRVVIPKLAPDLQAAVDAFIVGVLAFSILGCAGWTFLWEIKRRP